MCQDRPNVHLSAIIMHCRHEASLVAANIKDRQAANLVCMRKYPP